jgi:hypothetical protein
LNPKVVSFEKFEKIKSYQWGYLIPPMNTFLYVTPPVQPDRGGKITRNGIFAASSLNS